MPTKDLLLTAIESSQLSHVAVKQNSWAALSATQSVHLARGTYPTGDNLSGSVAGGGVPGRGPWPVPCRRSP